MNQDILINLRIAGRNLQLSVPEAEQALVEKAAELINSKLKQHSGSSMSQEERLLLTALEVAGDHLRQQEAAPAATPAATPEPPEATTPEAATPEASELASPASSPAATSGDDLPEPVKEQLRQLIARLRRAASP